MTPAEDAVRRADESRRTAMIDRDTRTLETLLDDDLMFVHGSARIDTKRSFVAGIAQEDTVYRSITISEDTYRQLSDSVVLSSCITEQQVLLDGAARDLRVRNVMVWRENRVGWQLVSYQSTAIKVQ